MRFRKHAGLRGSALGWLLAVVTATSGCHNGSPDLSKPDEAKMRASMSVHPQSINDLPPDQRQKIQDYFRNGAGTAAGVKFSQSTAKPSKQ